MLFTALLVVSCEDDGGSGIRNPGGGGDGSSDDTGPIGDAVTLDVMVGDTNPLGPQITIVDPPNGDGVFRDQVRVAAIITDDNSLDPESVSASVVREFGDPPLVTRRMDLEDVAANRWAATLSLGGVPGGRLLVSVTASDTDDPANSNHAERFITHDVGPLIEFLSPSQDDQYFHGAMSYSFRVLYSAGTETSCNFDEVSIAGVQFNPALNVMNPCTFGGNVDFADDFDPDLIDNQYVLVVRASNGQGTQASVQRTFHVDNSGPQIEFETPLDNNIVGGTIDIVVTATDPSGVDPAAVRAQVSGAANPSITLLPIGADQYAAVYDTAELNSSIVSPSISVTAEDLWGTRSTRSIIVHIDNAPPVISLDPPDIRDRREVDVGLQCSHEYDPVGLDAADDLSCQLQVFFMRARVQDAGNQRPGQNILYPSFVDATSVELFAYDGTQDLIVDLDGDPDNTCDGINPALEPTPMGLPGEAWHNSLNPIPPNGSADFTADLSLPILYPCAPGDEDEPPDTLCDPTLMTRAMNHGQTVEPEIYTLGEPEAGALCSGTQFDTLGNGFTEGWICFAVRARDQAGNWGISDPLRVYVDLDGVGACPMGAAPDCTDGCTYNDWAATGVFPPFPQKFVEVGQAGFPFGEIHDLN